MKKITLGFAVLKGFFRKKLVLGQLNQQSLSLVDKNFLWLTPYKGNVCLVEGLIRPDASKSLEDLNFSLTFSLFKRFTEYKKNAENLSELDTANAQIIFLVSILSSLEFILRNKNQRLFTYWLTNNPEIDQEYKELALAYLNEMSKYL